MFDDRSGRRSAPPESSAPIHFDATQRRRERMRHGGSPSPRPDPQAPSRPAATRADLPPAPQLPAPAAPVAGVRGGQAAPATADAVAPARPRRSSAELAAFLVNFVVEQTGYPPEIVELDADLEADLGIDSIKKAQLFGEIGEYFSIPPRADLALDDFPTLRHVLAFLVDATA